MQNQNTPLNKSFTSKTLRNDDTLQKKWSPAPKLNSYVDPGIDFSHDPGLTNPADGPDCDINNIVAKYHKTGVLPNTNVQGVFADVSDMPTYQDALQIVINAENQFMALDANTRRKFDNDPAKFLDFVDDPRNGPDLVKMGLATLVPPPPSLAAPDLPGGQPEALKKASKPSKAQEES